MFKLSKHIQRKRRFTRRRKIMAGMALIVLLAIGFFLHVLTTPVHGHAITAKLKLVGEAPVTATPTVAPATTVGSTYFTLNLPVGYTPQANSQATPGLLYEQTILKESEDGSLLIALSIKNMPSGGMTTDTSYQFRSSQPALYQISNKTVGSDTLKIAAATQSDGVVAFWPHGNYLATLSVTTGLNDTDAGDVPTEQATLNSLISNWQWK